MTKTLVLTEFDAAHLAALHSIAAGKTELVFLQPDCAKDSLHTALKEADMILGDLEPEDLPYCARLSWMQITWAGADSYVSSGLFPKSATLCGMSGAYGAMIAEYEMAAILSLSRCLPQYGAQQAKCLWQFADYDKPIEGSTALILGAGDIGTQLARRLRPFGVSIIGMRRVARACPPEFDRIIGMDELDAFLPQADIVACSLPSTPQTKLLLNKPRLASMKKDAILVNVGRGNLIDLDALSQLLSRGHFHGVALDVTNPEPLPEDHPLWQQSRLILTPHISGSNVLPASPTGQRIFDRMLENFRLHLEGLPCKNVIDFSTGYRKLSE